MPVFSNLFSYDISIFVLYFQSLVINAWIYFYDYVLFGIIQCAKDCCERFLCILLCP